MRVEIVESLASPSEMPGEAFSDVAVERALKNFLGVMGGDDSLFAAQNAGVRLRNVDGNQCLCAGTLLIRFRDAQLAQNRTAQFSLVAKLGELLKQAGSADALAAMLSLSPPGADSAQQEPALTLRLEATANSPEQAGLRWGLGLAHVQQALLFVSRVLRQQLTRTEN
jgi:hypothetical protein